MSAAVASGLQLQTLSAAVATPRTASAGLQLQMLSGRRADAIELGRLELGATIADLCQAAGLNTVTYHRNVVLGRARPATLAKLEAGLAVLRRRGRPDPAAATALVRATFGAFVAMLARAQGIEPAAVHGQDPRRGATADPAWRAAARVRQAAIYLTNTALNVPQRALAAALGLTPAAVCLALRDVESRRDDPDFDRLLDRLAADVTGTGEGGR